MINKFHDKTPVRVRTILKDLQRTKQICRIFECGKDGVSWPEVCDTVGRIESSAGPQKIPLMIDVLSDQMGGSGLLDHCIGRIDTIDLAGRINTVYSRKNFTIPLLTVGPNVDNKALTGGLAWATYLPDGSQQSGRKTELEAHQYVAFLNGLTFDRPWMSEEDYQYEEPEEA